MTHTIATSAVPGPRTVAGPEQSGTGGTEPQPDRLQQVAAVLVLPFTVVEGLLPRRPVPVALGASALALGGVLDWPAAAAIGLGWLAVRGWARDRSRPTPAVTGRS